MISWNESVKTTQKAMIRTVSTLTLYTLHEEDRMLDQTAHRPLLTSRVTRGPLANLFNDGA